METRLEQTLKFIELNKLKRESDVKIRYIYLIKCRCFYKVGIADDPKKRLTTIQVDCPYPVSIVKTWFSINPRPTERRIHAMLEQYHVRGEWFKLPKDVVNQIVSTVFI